MEAILLRTTSGTGRNPPSISVGSPKGHFYGQDHAFTGVSFSGRSSTPSPRSPLHCAMKERSQIPTGFRRALSDTDLIRSEMACSGMSRTRSRILSPSITARIAEEENLSDEGVFGRGLDEDNGSLMLKWKSLDLGISDRVPAISAEEVEVSGGGIGKGREVGGGNRGGDGGGEFAGGSADRSEIGAYYQEMLKMDPGNPLLLRNYAKFLHEVERDFDRAEEYYGRAILANPGDGDVLSLYGKLVWEMDKDEPRAKSYFDQAIKAAPDDCYVLGSYAHFMWDTTEDEEGGGGGGQGEGIKVVEKPASFVEAC